MGGVWLRNFLVCLGIAFLVVLSGCGGGDSTTAAGGGDASASNQGFVEQAEAICGRTKKQSLAVIGSYVKSNQGSGKSKAQQVADAIHNAFLPLLQKQVDELRALEPPEGKEDQVSAFLDAMEEGVEKAEKTSANAQFGSSFQGSGQLARELGIPGCAYSGN